MQMKKQICVSIIILLTIAFSVLIAYSYHNILDDYDEHYDETPLFFGVSFGGKTTSEAKLMIDKVKSFTNFLLVNSWDLSTNETALNEVCDYAVKAGLNFIVFFDFSRHCFY